MERRKFIKISGIILTTSLTGCINQQNNNSNGNQPQNTNQNTTSNQNQSVITPRLSVQNQIMNGSEIKINEISIDKQGWIIIHPKINNETQTQKNIYGYRELQPGNYTDLSLDLIETIERNQTVYASLYYINTIDNPRNISNREKPISINGDTLRRSIDISIKQKNQNNNQKNTQTVILEDTSFKPSIKNINPGDTVKWINEDKQSYGHTIKSTKFHDTAKDWSFESQVLGTGDETRYTFTELGIYQYYCTIHGQNKMCGTIIVGDISLNQTLPCET